MPPAASAFDREPEIVAAPRVEPGRGLVHEQEPRRADEAGTEVEPSLHAAGVRPNESVAGLGEPELLEDLVGRGVPGPTVVTEEPGDHAEVLAARQRGLDGRELAGEADRPAHLLRVFGDVDAADPQHTCVGAEQRGDRANECRLPGAVRAEHREHRPGRCVEIQTGECLDLAEPFGEALGLDHQAHVSS